MAKKHIIGYDVRTNGRPSVVTFAGLRFTPSKQRVPAERLNPEQLKRLLSFPGLEVTPIEAEEKK